MFPVDEVTPLFLVMSGLLLAVSVLHAMSMMGDRFGHKVASAGLMLGVSWGYILTSPLPIIPALITQGFVTFTMVPGPRWTDLQCKTCAEISVAYGVLAFVGALSLDRFAT